MTVDDFACDAVDIVPDDIDKMDLAATLKRFEFVEVLQERPIEKAVYLLGKIDGQDAIVHIIRAALPMGEIAQVVKNLCDLDMYICNDPTYAARAWLGRQGGLARQQPDLEVRLHWPAAPSIIRKYSKQESVLVHDTPEMHRDVVVPFSQSSGANPMNWILEILAQTADLDSDNPVRQLAEGQDAPVISSEVLYSKPGPEGYVVLQDLKWDGVDPKYMYIAAWVRDPSLTCMRDLGKAQLPLLRDIQRSTTRLAEERYDVPANRLRVFVHCQPTFYRVHVHVVHIDNTGFPGMEVGDAHMLDDLISLLELSPDPPEPSILSRMTITYALGMQGNLYRAIQAHEAAQPAEAAAATTTNGNSHSNGNGNGNCSCTGDA